MIHDAKIALMEQAFEIKKTEIGTEMRIQRPEDIQSFLDQEEHILKRFADKLQEVGANFVVNSKGIDDTAAHYLNKYGITAIKSVSKTDMENLQRAIGGKINESIDSLTENDLGAAEKVEFKKIGNDELCFISGCTNAKAVSILLRGGSSSVLDEADRSLHDALCVVASLHDRSEIVGGGGAVEMEICQRLLDFAKGNTGKEQIAIETFARALEIIPITLSENAGLDPINIIAELRSKHVKPGNEFMGLDIFQAAIVDNRESGVIEPVANIDQIIKVSLELVIMILCIDDMIKSKSSGGAGG
jgi:chaperonin GroEL (HSP60 family)